MAKFDNWSQEDLAWKCRELSDEVEQLEKELSERKDEICGLHLRIETELEPRLRMDKLKPCLKTISLSVLIMSIILAVIDACISKVTILSTMYLTMFCVSMYNLFKEI